MKNKLIRLLPILAMFVAGVVFPNTASALTLSPTRFEIKANPGDIIEEEVMLINEEDSTETFYSSYANFEAQGESGSPAFTVPKEGLGTWIKTEAPAFTVSPGEQRPVKFTITIPKDAEPGGHFAVVFWGTSAPDQNGKIGVGAKTGALVLVSVAGDVEIKGGLLSFATKAKQFFYKTLPVSFEYRFQNEGGDRIKPQGTISISDTLFIPAKKLDANPIEGNILPNSIRKFNIDWVNYERPLDYIPSDSFMGKYWENVAYEWKNFALGLYSARLKIAYGEPVQYARKTIFFFVFPWELFIVLVVIISILYFGGRKSIKKYNRYIIKKAREGMSSHNS